MSLFRTTSKSKSFVDPVYVLKKRQIGYFPRVWSTFWRFHVRTSASSACGSGNEEQHHGNRNSSPTTVPTFIDHYAVLGLPGPFPRETSQKTADTAIKTAYFRKAKQCHPDAKGNREGDAAGASARSVPSASATPQENQHVDDHSQSGGSRSAQLQEEQLQATLSSSNGAASFLALNQAYRALKNAGARLLYDRAWRGNFQPEEVSVAFEEKRNTDNVAETRWKGPAAAASTARTLPSEGDEPNRMRQAPYPKSTTACASTSAPPKVNKRHHANHVPAAASTVSSSSSRGNKSPANRAFNLNLGSSASPEKADGSTAAPPRSTSRGEAGRIKTSCAKRAAHQPTVLASHVARAGEGAVG
ncbi:unnamed protein product [Amoebophrya sp. A120]|nr:unnamed protein product [Amoebophrya sp. A120]|eukprot:GSA120T00022116001.1